MALAPWVEKESVCWKRVRNGRKSTKRCGRPLSSKSMLFCDWHVSEALREGKETFPPQNRARDDGDGVR